jgi:NADH-quinone oxidoreductase subunit J
MIVTIQQLVFYSFSALAILAGCMVVASKNPVRAVLWLVFTFFCMAGIWMLLESEFLAIALVLVYVGAVMVLFLFVVMMLDIEAPKLKDPFVKHWPIGVFVSLLLLGLIIVMVGKQHFGLEIVSFPSAKPVDYSNVKALGNLLYTDYLLPFEIAGVVLLVAMIAAIGLTFRGPRESKTQKPAKQIQVSKSDRLRIVKMQAQKGSEA